MKTTTALALAAALALSAGCDTDSQTQPQTQPQAGAGGSAPRASSTPTTPANLPPPQSSAEKREGSNPVQQQVDPKQDAQQRDFRMKGEGAGPRGGG